MCWATCSRRSPRRRAGLQTREIALTGQVSSAEEVDMAATLSRLIAGADADAGLVSAHCLAEQPVSGEVFAGRMMKMRHASPAVNSKASVWLQARKNAALT